MNYKIKFYSIWHCGSGLSAGADLDSLVIKDKNRMPFIPGKTLKGLIKEAVEDYLSLSEKNKEQNIQDLFYKTFGDEKNGIVGDAFFSNASLNTDEYNAIIADKLQKYLYVGISSTAIDETTGTADPHSLRRMQGVVPCTLYAEINNIPLKMEDVIKKGISMIKRMGQNRNRGFGRCDFQICEKGGEK